MNPKEILEQLQKTFDEMKTLGDRRDGEIKKLGGETAQTREAIEKAQNDMNALEAQLKTLEAKMNRLPQNLGDEKSGQNPEQRRAFFNFLRQGKSEMAPEQRKALVENTDGQILVPADLEQEIYRSIGKITVVRGLASVRPTQRDRVRRRSLGEVSVGWGKLETGTSLSDSMPSAPTEAYLYIEDLYGLAKIGEDELDDTDTALEAYVSDSFARAIAEAEDTAFIVGTGHGSSQPEGILNGSVVTRVNAGQAAAITADDFIKLSYAVPAQYRANGVYIMRSATEQSIRLLKDSNGLYLWQPSIQAGRPNTLNGYPVYNQDNVPSIPAGGSAADVAIFGSVRDGYQIRDRQGIAIQRLNELYAASGMIGWKVRYRVGGAVVRADALRVLRVPAS